MERKNRLRTISLFPDHERMTLEQFRAFIESRLNEIPKEHAENAVVYFEPGYGGDEFHIEWVSPETDDELAVRLKAEVDYEVYSRRKTASSELERRISTPDGLAAEQGRIYRENSTE